MVTPWPPRQLILWSTRPILNKPVVILNLEFVELWRLPHCQYQNLVELPPWRPRQLILSGPSTQYMVDASCIQIKPGGNPGGEFWRTTIVHYTTLYDRQVEEQWLCLSIQSFASTVWVSELICSLRHFVRFTCLQCISRAHNQ